MAFTEDDRIKIRRWLGFPAIFTQAIPMLESAITSIQSIADGGNRPDSSAESAIKDYLTNLATIETQMMRYVVQMQALKVDEISIDAVRGLHGLKNLGRMYVGHIADILGTKPIRDVFVAPRIASQDRPTDFNVKDIKGY